VSCITFLHAFFNGVIILNTGCDVIAAMPVLQDNEVNNCVQWLEMG